MPLFNWAVLLGAMGIGQGWAQPVYVANEVAAAPAEGPPNLQEVRVTARRREENLQDVPISVSVVAQESMNDVPIPAISTGTYGGPGLFFDLQNAQVLKDPQSPAANGSGFLVSLGTLIPQEIVQSGEWSRALFAQGTYALTSQLKVTDEELGIKSDWRFADIAIRTNADVWYESYTSGQK